MNVLHAAFANLPHAERKDLPPMEKCAAPATPRYFTEEMDIAQGKLSVGWRCITEDVTAMILAILLFGGTSNAKLFMNVCENMKRLGIHGYTRRRKATAAASGLEHIRYANVLNRNFSAEQPLEKVVTDVKTSLKSPIKVSHSAAFIGDLISCSFARLHCHQRKSLCKVEHVRTMVLLSAFQNENIIHRDAEQVA